MADFRIRRNVKDTWIRRSLMRILNLIRKRRRTSFIVIGTAVVVIAAAVLVIIITSSQGYAKTASNVGPVPTYTGTAAPNPTETQTPIPTTPPPPDPTLKYGDENDQVQALQQRLMDLGYLDIDEPTQKFGSATKTAVQWFQRQVGLDQTGIADSKTLDWIDSDEAPPYTLMEGTSGSDVDSLQKQLIDLGYLSKATGYYGTETITAVKDFQTRNKLSVDGKTGEKTLALIYSPNARVSASKLAEKRIKANIDQMIAAAENKLGRPYVSGAEGPNSFDCSGLVYWCLKQAGSNRGRYNAQGYSAVKDWTTVCSGKMDLKKLKKGDLLFFHVADRGKPIGHVAIYIGGGMVIDASSSNGKVVKRSCTGHWFTSCFRLAKRPW